jgi:hypothetical protein
MTTDADNTAVSDCPAATCHHRRYALAWSLYRDESLTDDARETLEREMDSAQNLFGWDEFQTFKQTLSGFVEHWANWKRDALKILEQNKRI